MDVLFYETSRQENAGIQKNAGVVWATDSSQRPLYPTIYRWVGKGYLLQGALLRDVTPSQRKKFFDDILSRFGPTAEEEFSRVNWAGKVLTGSLTVFGNPMPQTIG